MNDSRLERMGDDAGLAHDIDGLLTSLEQDKVRLVRDLEICSQLLRQAKRSIHEKQEQIDQLQVANARLTKAVKQRAATPVPAAKSELLVHSIEEKRPTFAKDAQPEATVQGPDIDNSILAKAIATALAKATMAR